MVNNIKDFRNKIRETKSSYVAYMEAVHYWTDNNKICNLYNEGNEKKPIKVFDL